MEQDAIRQLEQHRELYARALRTSALELESRIEELGLLRQVGRLFERSRRAEDLVTHALPLFLQLSPAQNASVMLLSRATGELNLLAAVGRGQAQVAYYGPDGYAYKLFRLGEGLAGNALADREPLVADDAVAEPRFRAGVGKVRVGSLACLPLQAHDEPLGVVNLSHPDPQVIRSERLPAWAILASYLSVALSHALLFEELRTANRTLEGKVRERTRSLERSVHELETTRSELAEHSRVLERRVQERTRELEEAAAELRIQNQALGEANRIKEEFLNNINHELKTPLNSIIGYAGLLLREAQGSLSAEQSTDLALIEANGKHLQQILDNIFALKDIESGAVDLHRTPTDLNELIASVVASLRPRAEEKGLGLAFEPAEMPPLAVDPTLLRRVLFNLLDNAVKFSQQGRITVRSRPARRNAARPQEDGTAEAGGTPHAVVEIADQGKGIPPEDADRIFQKFQQGEPPTRKSEGGSGLGLTIAKNLVELHGGRIWVTSRPGRGSTFGFCLPYDG